MTNTSQFDITPVLTLFVDVTHKINYPQVDIVYMIDFLFQILSTFSIDRETIGGIKWMIPVHEKLAKWENQ